MYRLFHGLKNAYKEFRPYTNAWSLWHRQDKSDYEIFEVVIGAILTQNTSWKNVAKALQALETHAKSFQEILDLNLEELKTLIRPAGYFNQKAAYLKRISQFFIKMNNRPSREELLSCKGVGPETADAILLYAFDQPIPVVDSYTRRILARVLDKPEYLKINYLTLQEEILNNIPNGLMQLRMFHTLLIVHGQAVCHKKKPHCSKCPLINTCAYRKPNSS